jgi:hypothetical protein
MNRTRRKAAKMFKRRYGKATNPFWQSQRENDPYSGLTQERLDAAMKACYNSCVVIPTTHEFWRVECYRCGKVYAPLNELDRKLRDCGCPPTQPILQNFIYDAPITETTPKG